jgi:hypothetical protein
VSSSRVVVSLLAVLVLAAIVPVALAETPPTATAAFCPRWGCTHHDGRDCSLSHAFAQAWPSDAALVRDKKYIRLKLTPIQTDEPPFRWRADYRIKSYKGVRVVACRIRYATRSPSHGNVQHYKRVKVRGRIKGSFEVVSQDGHLDAQVLAMVAKR